MNHYSVIIWVSLCPKSPVTQLFVLQSVKNYNKQKLNIPSAHYRFPLVGILHWPVFPEKWWRHQMEVFPRYWPFVRGIHRWPVNSPHKCQRRGVLMFSLICAWINGWVNNRETGDFRRHRAHYDVTVMPKRHKMHITGDYRCWWLIPCNERDVSSSISHD